MHLRVKKTSDIKFSSELLVLFLMLGESGVTSTREDGSSLGGTKFMLSFLTTKHVGVDTEIGRSFADPFGLGEFERPKPVRCCPQGQEWLEVCIRMCTVCV